MPLTTRQSRMLGTSDGAAATVAPAVLGLHSVRTSQPQQAVGIDWGNPITRGLVFSALPTDAISSGIARSVSGAVTSDVIQAGRGVKFSDASAAYVSYASPALKPATGAPYSLLAFYKLNATPSTSARLVSSFASASYGYTLAPNNTNFRAIISGGANVTLTGAAIHTNPKVDVLTFDGSNGRYYESGSLSAGPTAATSNVSLRDFFIGSDSVGSNSAPGTVVLTAFWNRALSDAEVKSLSQNPWQIFLPLNRQIWVAA